ncbi:succinate dehydrogenase, cytochrome b556 subunit [Altererythrobacter aquiaggeris]|uniref:succinate dehydrogenase, cytochrome b556 subunit n=1 Tax=Aestuarierythrobacter aquiaggeris TaxID=1898396 RepID=UPI0030181E3A
MADRPLSPHLQIWKWGPHMLTSILHRVTGNALAFAALPLLLWWLGSMASGEGAYNDFIELATSPFGYFVLAGISWSFFNHLVSGLRHFVMDIGAGYELDTNKMWSIASPVLGILLTAGFWALALLA